MTKDNVITLPNTNLRERSKKISIITNEVETLINNMKEATLDWEANRDHEVGVALAAIQVDIPLRVVVIRNDFDNKKDKTFSVFINPIITKYEGEVEEDYEGCLSVPDVYGKVPRHNKVRIRALDATGREIRITAEGFLARVFQHEIDHTNGIVFIDHIKDMPEAFFRLRQDGQLEKLDYEKDVRNNHILW
ncbi:MAG TPA: peptide deformylase [Patescibacteria group bacterium]|nr:peptide deformylase [Patescibacteria group bacterium]